jgi:hypothetical protein
MGSSPLRPSCRHPQACSLPWLPNLRRRCCCGRLGGDSSRPAQQGVQPSCTCLWIVVARLQPRPAVESGRRRRPGQQQNAAAAAVEAPAQQNASRAQANLLPAHGRPSKPQAVPMGWLRTVNPLDSAHGPQRRVGMMVKACLPRPLRGWRPAARPAACAKDEPRGPQPHNKYNNRRL